MKQVNSQLTSMLDQIFLDMNTNTKKIMENQPVNAASTTAAIPNTKAINSPISSTPPIQANPTLSGHNGQKVQKSAKLLSKASNKTANQFQI